MFEHVWTENDPLSGKGDGLGPVFNSTSCVACHFQGGVGGSSGNNLNVVSFETIIEEDGEQVADSPMGVIHKQAITSDLLEKREHVRELYPAVSQTREIEPGQDFSGCSSSSSSSIEETIDPLVFHELNSPALFGVGLIDEISNVSVSIHGHKRMVSKISEEFSGDFDGNRLGMINMDGGNVGKFGWKGQFASLEDFVASACAMELGLTNAMHSQPVPGEYRANDKAKMDMTKKQLHELVCFVRSLPRPKQVLPVNSVALDQVKQGQEMFMKVGCADCHVQDFAGIDDIFSDFHLYNLEPVSPRIAQGQGYSDGKAEEEFDFDRTRPHPDQWQTPPLWGVADSAPYFHDGGSGTLKLAIERHHGQAKSSLDRFQGLTVAEQTSLVAFLKTLKAPQVQSKITDRDLVDRKLGNEYRVAKQAR